MYLNVEKGVPSTAALPIISSPLASLEDVLTNIHNRHFSGYARLKNKKEKSLAADAEISYLKGEIACLKGQIDRLLIYLKEDLLKEDLGDDNEQ